MVKAIFLAACGMTLALFLISPAAANPMISSPSTLQTTTVFDATRDGYEQYRIPVLCVSARGTVLAAIEARHTGTDWGDIQILLRRSEDGGHSFGPPQSIARWDGEIKRAAWLEEQHAHAAKKGRTYHNAVLIADRDGTIHFLFGIEYSHVFYRRSNDDGRTWSQTRDITAAFEPLRQQYPWRVVATGPGLGVQLSGGARDGRLVVPIWLARGSHGAGGDHRPSVVSSVFSDDGGQTWQTGDIIAHETEPARNPNETVVAQLPDGRVYFNIRSEAKQHRRLIATSPDGATAWTTPHFDDELFEPICHAGLVRAGDELLFSNPNPALDAPQRYPEIGHLQRENLIVRMSHNGGETWPVSRVLDAGSAGYSALGVLPDGSFLCLWERGQKEGDWPGHTVTLARFDWAWLTSTP